VPSGRVIFYWEHHAGVVYHSKTYSLWLLNGVLYDTTIVPLLNSIALDDHEVDILLDAHQEMRLEIEDMSYDVEFIALGERIGSVSTGLSKETITTQLETRFYTRNPENINFKEFRYNVIRELFQNNTIRV